MEEFLTGPNGLIFLLICIPGLFAIALGAMCFPTYREDERFAGILLIAIGVAVIGGDIIGVLTI